MGPLVYEDENIPGLPANHWQWPPITYSLAQLLWVQNFLMCWQSHPSSTRDKTSRGVSKRENWGTTATHRYQGSQAPHTPRMSQSLESRLLCLLHGTRPQASVVGMSVVSEPVHKLFVHACDHVMTTSRLRYFVGFLGRGRSAWHRDTTTTTPIYSIYSILSPSEVSIEPQCSKNEMPNTKNEPWPSGLPYYGGVGCDSALRGW
jgi:hypothetical protein